MIRMLKRFLTATTLCFTALSLNAVTASAQSLQATDLFGPHYTDGTALARAVQRTRPPLEPTTSIVRRWNGIALSANAFDHGSAVVEHPGPLRTARAFAIVHIAIGDAVNAITGGQSSYTRIGQAPRGASMTAAVAQAAHDTLAALYASQQTAFAGYLAEDLDKIPASRAKSDGIALGKRAAAAILQRRADDGAAHAEAVYGVDYHAPAGPGKWHQDPIARHGVALGVYWSRNVRPFVLRSAGQYPTPAPPALNSAAFASAFNEVKNLGGCGNTHADPAAACATAQGGTPTATTRTAEQAIVGIYWGYDGTPGLGTPPRLYNQIALTIAAQMRTDDVQLARLLALVNVAMADAGITAWETKYLYAFARPVTAIREAAAYRNRDIRADPTWTPLGAPASNLIGPNFTPPFPAYTSGHATFGAALFQTLRKFYRTDRIAFTFVSDEYNGVTTDNTGVARPRVPRSFRNLSEAEEENGQSRVYLGIHWSFDKTAGIAQGQRVADFVFDNY